MRYESPQTLDEAIGLLAAANGSGKILAGGTDLLVQMGSGALRPESVVDIKRIPELGRIEQGADGFRIGAAVPAARLGEHAALRAAWPGVVEAAELIGSTQIQSRASLGGNLCNASPAADSVAALVAAGAVCSVAGPKGRRNVPVEEIGIGPGRTSLARDELVVDFLLPPRPPRSGDAYLRLIPRSEMDIAIVGAGVSLSLDQAGRCSSCRVAIAAVAPRVLLVAAAGEALLGSALEAPALERLIEAVRSVATPIDDLRGTAAYRRQVVGVLARRAAARAFERARSEA